MPRVLLALALAAAPAAALFGFGGAKEQPTPEPLPRHLQGVPAGAEAQYSGATFTCASGGGALPAERINDNYCDCEDGSDEPGTPACARGRFFCPNAGFQGKSVPASLVWDGHCDCCDGTDEQAGGLVKCRNTCEADGASWRAAREEGARRASEGARARRALVAAAADAARTRGASLEAARAKQASARAAREAAEAAAAPLVAADDAAHAAAQARASADGGLTALDAALGTAGLDARALAEVLIATARDAPSTTWLMDTLTARAAAGELPGVPAGFVPAWLGGSSERGEAGSTADAAELAAALGVSGMERGALLLLAHGAAKGAGASAQLMDHLKARGAGGAWLDDPTAVARSESEGARAAARALEEAKTAETAAGSEVSALEAEGATDFGPGGAFFSLKGQCYDLAYQQYTYSVCPFGQAKQDSTHLGSFSAWGTGAGGASDYGVMAFTGGSGCWNGPARSIKVAFECAPETKLLSIDEPEKCTYAARMSTPAACAEESGAAAEAALGAGGSVSLDL